MNETKIVTQPEDVAALKDIAKACGKEEWDFSTPGQVGFENNDDSVEAENGRLTKLDLSGNDNLSDLSPLAGLTALTRLFLAFTNIRDLSPLAGLKRLACLDLSYNEKLSGDLKPLAGLTALAHLELRDSLNIADFTPLGQLPALAYLDLKGAKKSRADLGPLAERKGLNIAGLLDGQSGQQDDKKAFVEEPEKPEEPEAAEPPGEPGEPGEPMPPEEPGAPEAPEEPEAPGEIEAPGESEPESPARLRFWQAVSAGLAERSVQTPPPKDKASLDVSLGRTGFFLSNTLLRGGGMAVRLMLAGKGQDELYPRLLAARKKIEKELGAALTWSDPDEAKKVISLAGPPLDLDKEVDFAPAVAWMAEWIAKFKEVFEPLVKIF